MTRRKIISFEISCERERQLTIAKETNPPKKIGKTDCKIRRLTGGKPYWSGPPKIEGATPAPQSKLKKWMNRSLQKRSIVVSPHFPPKQTCRASGLVTNKLNHFNVRAVAAAHLPTGDSPSFKQLTIISPHCSGQVVFSFNELVCKKSSLCPSIGRSKKDIMRSFGTITYYHRNDKNQPQTSYPSV